MKPRIYWSFGARAWMWTAWCPGAGAHRSWAGPVRNLETHIQECRQCLAARYWAEQVRRATTGEICRCGAAPVAHYHVDD